METRLKIINAHNEEWEWGPVSNERKRRDGGDQRWFGWSVLLPHLYVEEKDL